MNLPNLLTVFRMGAAFVFLAYGWRGRWDVAFPVFSIAAVTDMVDGTLARLMRQRTRLGAILDPAADKILMLFGFVTLTGNRLLPLLFTAFMIGRDLLIVGGVVILKWRKVPRLYQPTYLSKVTTFFQIATIFEALLVAQSPSRLVAARYDTLIVAEAPYTNALRLVTLVLTVITGVQYLRIGFRMLQNEKTQTHRQ